VTNVLDQENMFFYEAEITSGLLSALQNPKDARIPAEWPTIRRKKLPYRPYDSFASRLIAELVAPGPVSANLPASSDASILTISKGKKRSYKQEVSRPHKIRRVSVGGEK
jgi:hypothetical protein